MRNTLVVLPLLLLTSGCYNWTGQNHDRAVENAHKWVKDMGYEDVKVSCNQHDSDHDGYVSCSLNINGEFIQLECAGEDFVDRNEGCRAPKINIRPVTYQSDVHVSGGDY